MALYGSDFNYSRTGLKLVTGAFNEINAFDAEETLPSDDLTFGLDKATEIIKQWMGRPNRFMPGIKVWRHTTDELSLSAKANYEIHSGSTDLDIEPPTHIISARRKDTDDNEVPLTAMLREEYEAISNKGQTATPTKYLYELHLDKGYFWLNMIPSDITDVIRLMYIEPTEDVAQTNTIDCPQELYRALRYQLASDLCPAYAPEMYEMMEAKAAQAMALAQSFYPENVKLFFQPGLVED